MSKTGTEFTVRNAGEGGGCGDDYRNQIFCVQQNVGDDVDVVHYSWSYFEQVIDWSSLWTALMAVLDRAATSLTCRQSGTMRQ